MMSKKCGSRDTLAPLNKTLTTCHRYVLLKTIEHPNTCHRYVLSKTIKHPNISVLCTLCKFYELLLQGVRGIVGPEHLGCESIHQ